MKGRNEDATLDDIIDLYLVSSEQTNEKSMDELILRYPQYEDELREFIALQLICGKIPDHQYTKEEEQSLEEQAASIAQNILYEQRHRSEPEPACASQEDEGETITGILDEAKKRNLSMESFVEETNLSEGLLRMCDSPELRYETIPSKVIENISLALGISVSIVNRFLKRSRKIKPSHYKARQAPETSHLYHFSEIVEIDEDLTPEQKLYWLSQPPIESEEEQ